MAFLEVVLQIPKTCLSLAGAAFNLGLLLQSLVAHYFPRKFLGFPFHLLRAAFDLILFSLQSPVGSFRDRFS